MSQPRTRLKRRPFVPSLEALEGRDVPCTVVYGQGLLGGTDIFEYDLLIRGGRKGEAIVINDDGTGNGVVVLCNGVTVWSGSQPVTGIRVDTGHRRRDSVTYNLTGDLAGELRLVRVSMGNGKPQAFEANLNGTIRSDANNNPGTLDLFVEGNDRGDRLTVNARGQVLGKNSRLDLTLDGGLGSNTMAVNALPGVDVGPGATLDIGMTGGPGRDAMSAAYEGKVQGFFEFHAAGGAGNDAISAALAFDNTSGGGPMGPQAYAQVQGGPGNDHLSLTVQGEAQLSPGNKRFVLDGGRGFNTGHAEGDVAVFRCRRLV
jgi:hypothetical protein